MQWLLARQTRHGHGRLIPGVADMDEDGFVIPAPAAYLLQRLPGFPPAWVFAQLLNAVLLPGLDADLIEALEERRIRLRITDARVQADLVVRAGWFRVAAGSLAPDVAIAASMRDFLLLARRIEDPDALFFARRLLIEGDTALGLRVKNALDALDLPPFDARSLAPAKVFGWIRTWISCRSVARDARMHT
jgi:predicted lipid carrier protein YhbT